MDDPTRTIQSSSSIFTKKDRMTITIYGPYGSFKKKLSKITRILREKYGYKDCRIVAERAFRKRQQKEDKKGYLTKKSFHYLTNSHVVIFIFYCDTEDNTAHNESPSIEISHLIFNTDKINCCYVLKDKNCDMPTVLEGILKLFPLKMDEFDGYENKCENNLATLLQGKFVSFLKDKYYQIK